MEFEIYNLSLAVIFLPVSHRARSKLPRSPFAWCNAGLWVILSGRITKLTGRLLASWNIWRGPYMTPIVCPRWRTPLIQIQTAQAPLPSVTLLTSYSTFLNLFTLFLMATANSPSTCNSASTAKQALTWIPSLLKACHSQFWGLQCDGNFS
ncbi:hypothetical protein P692DRAFT_2060289 [Suillus brevipes Sb2]|nr:hypothetical protein P692DRAFT_2060289 [Suillus brevipes Sb2]